MDPHRLRVFRATARLGGFTKAGEQIHLPLSTVSQHVQTLEEELGTRLLLRVGKRRLVTKAGNVLLQYAERVLREVKDAEIAVRELSTTKRSTVRVGAGATTLTYRLPPILADYARRFPGIELVAVTGAASFVAQSGLDSADLEKSRLILYEKNTAMQNVIDRHFDRLGVPPCGHRDGKYRSHQKPAKSPDWELQSCRFPQSNRSGVDP
jgi:DNA-binding transcriptional ArsR family regulator